MRTDTTVNRVALDIIKKHTYRPDADYSDSWILKAMEEYARRKWDQACDEQRDHCVAQFINSPDVKVNQYSAREYCANAPKPEFKP